jgi:hypothetical protein
VHEILADVESALTQLRAAVLKIPVTNHFGSQWNNWSFPAITKDDMVVAIDDLLSPLREGGDKVDDDDADGLKDWPSRLTFVRTQTLPQLTQGNAGQASMAFFETLRALARGFDNIGLGPQTAEEQRSIAADLKKLRARVQAMAARLNEVEPTSMKLADLVQRIESANEAADRLPLELADLETAAGRLTKASAEIAAAKDAAGDAASRAIRHADTALQKQGEVDGLIKQSRELLRASTSVGLAAAFEVRSAALGASIRWWVGGLAASLLLGGAMAFWRLSEIAKLLDRTSVPIGTVLLNLLLSVMTVGGAVWFSWLATKQIGQRFRLSEDYAFKASVSKAYEGYRTEAVNVDKALVQRLLGSALDRLDELPLRTMDKDSHGSPMAELLNSRVMRDALKLAPELVSRFRAEAAATVKKARGGPSTQVVTPELDADATGPT